MQCRDVEQLIDAFWDRELDPARAASIERHLSACQTCNQAFGRVHLFLNARDEMTVPVGLRDRILVAVESGRRAAPRRSLPPLGAPWHGALAACITIAFAGLLAWHVAGSRQHGIVPPPGIVETAPPGWVVGSYAQSMVMPAPTGPLLALSRAALFEQIDTRPPPHAMGFRPRVPECQPALTPAIHELPAIVAGLSRLGA